MISHAEMIKFSKRSAEASTPTSSEVFSPVCEISTSTGGVVTSDGGVVTPYGGVLTSDRGVVTSDGGVVTTGGSGVTTNNGGLVSTGGNVKVEGSGETLPRCPTAEESAFKTFVKLNRHKVIIEKFITGEKLESELVSRWGKMPESEKNKYFSTFIIKVNQSEKGKNSPNG